MLALLRMGAKCTQAAKIGAFSYTPLGDTLLVFSRDCRFLSVVAVSTSSEAASPAETPLNSANPFGAKPWLEGHNHIAGHSPTASDGGGNSSKSGTSSSSRGRNPDITDK